MVTLIVILLIGIVVSLFLYNRHKKEVEETFRQIGQECYAAEREFEQLCTPKRLFTDVEVQNYENKFGGLLSRSKIYLEISYLRQHSSYNTVHRFEEKMMKIRILQKNNNDIYNNILEINEAVKEPTKEIERYSVSYISNSELEYFRSTYRPLFEKIQAFEKDYLKRHLVSPLSGDAKKFAEVYAVYQSEQKRKEHNNLYMRGELIRCSRYFDELLSYPLDQQQRGAIVDLEDNELVVASAGSGKTSTIVGKANYLIHKLGVDPSKILLVTYTAKAAEELRQRIDVEGLVAATFHKHALESIGKITGSRPTLADKDLLNSIFLELMEHDKDFVTWFIKYETSCQNLMKDIFEYKSAQEYFADLEKYGKMSPYKDMDGMTKFLKSKQEIDIFVYLTELGLKLRYEEPFKYNTSDSQHRRYFPDFSIHYDVPDIDEEGNPILKHEILYLEHFAIDKNSNVPSWFGDGKQGGWRAANEQYNNDIIWKKQLHALHKTKFAYTTSAQFTDGSVFHRINEIISSFGIPVHPLTNDEKLALFSRNVETLQSSLKKLIISFITLMKANRKTINEIISTIPTEDEFKERNIDIIKHIIKPVYATYEAYLKNEELCDFTDVLLKAAELCENGNIYDYDYILVDEFQDMSMDKYLYLKSLRRKNNARITKLFCVGDDWQSIYRFAGNDMTLFFDFEKFFGYTSKRKIETTHRFGEPLISASSNFILKNSNQQKKVVAPDSKDRCTDIEFLSYDSESEERQVLEKEIGNLPEKSSISILARYNYEIDQLFPNIRRHEDDKYPEFEIKGRRVKFMSVHAAKGLEADYIFLIGCRGGINGFPSLVEDDPILGYVLSTADSFENAEERRVFYVALTRAKKCAFILYDRVKRSSFIDEFVNNYSEDELCPRCKNGKVLVKKDGITTRGHYYVLVGCNNPYCDYFEPIFFDEGETKVYSAASFISLYYPLSMCEPRIVVKEGKKCWIFDDPDHEQKNEIILNLSPKCKDFSTVNDMVIIVCSHGNITRYFASDRSIDTPRYTTVYNQSIEDVITKAIKKDRDVVIRYSKYNGEESERTLSKLRYATIDENHSYLTNSHISAFCHLRGEERDFKIDRIEAIRFTDSNLWISNHKF